MPLRSTARGGTLTLGYASGVSGTAAITVRATDTSGAFIESTFTVDVSPVDDAPTAVMLASISVPENLDTSGGYNVGTLSSSDPDTGDTHTYSVVGGADGAKFLISADLLMLDDGVLDYEAQSSYEVTVRSTDSGGLSVDNTFTIDVTDIDEAPSIGAVADQLIDEDSTSAPITFTIFDPETAAGTLVVAASSSDATLIPNGNLVLEAAAPAAPSPSRPAADAYGAPVTITLSVSDGVNLTQQTFTVTVGPVADTPSVIDSTTAEDTQTVSGLVISGNAVDGSSVTHFKITGISGGTLYQSDGITAIANDTFITYADGAAGLKFTPAPDSTAAGSFDVQAATAAADAGLGGSVVTATVTVNPVNDTPVLTANAGASLTSGGSLTIGNALLQVTDVDDAAGQIVYTVGSLPSAGTLSLAGVPLAVNGTFTQAQIDGGQLRYAHNGSSLAPDGFSFAVADASGASVGPASFAISVSAAAATAAATTAATAAAAAAAAAASHRRRLRNRPSNRRPTPVAAGRTPAMTVRRLRTPRAERHRRRRGARS